MRKSWVMPISMLTLAVVSMSQAIAQQAAPASANDADHLVALLIARPEITSMPDLSGKSIAIDDAQSRSSSSFQTAIVAAGAAEVQLSAGQTKALDRLINGEVPAAVLTLAYPEAAEWASDIAGFKVFRIPLAPRSLRAGLQPAGNPTADLQTARAGTGDLPRPAGTAAASAPWSGAGGASASSGRWPWRDRKNAPTLAVRPAESGWKGMSP